MDKRAAKQSFDIQKVWAIVKIYKKIYLEAKYRSSSRLFAQCCMWYIIESQYKTFDRIISRKEPKLNNVLNRIYKKALTF